MDIWYIFIHSDKNSYHERSATFVNGVSPFRFNSIDIDYSSNEMHVSMEAGVLKQYESIHIQSQTKNDISANAENLFRRGVHAQACQKHFENDSYYDTHYCCLQKTLYTLLEYMY